MTSYQADILTWTEAYQGEPMHAVLTDPPYGLNESELDIEAVLADWMAGKEHQPKGAGFMGREWDAFLPGPSIWRAIRRCCAPGAFLFAFGGTRTADLLALALRLAGWEKRDEIDWVYGCLSEDTEILTSDGWEPYHKAIEGRHVLCYNTEQDALEWHAVQELYTYAYDDTAYRIHSDHTDQIVSRNHRCLVERGGALTFRLAELLGSQEAIPTVESLRGLLPPVPNRKQSTHTQENVLGCVQANKASVPSKREAPCGTQGRDHHVSGVRYAGMEARRVVAQVCNPSLFPPVQRCAALTTSGQVFQQRQGQKEPQKGQSRREQSSMEGRRNLLQDARQLYRREVRAVSTSVYGHGAQGWLRDGASIVRSSGNGTPATAHRGGTSQGSQSSKQRFEQPSVVRQQSRPQALRASRIARSDLATVTPIHYQGIVWCVRVPTGAFVARRNGQIFITGNSGFPKNQNISKAIDRAAKADRPIIGTKKHQPKFDAKGFEYRKKDNGFNSKDRTTFDVTGHATELAQAWDGYGTALKPAHEPILVFRNPLKGTYAQNCTATGAGALNIDQARIAGSKPLRENTSGDEGLFGLGSRMAVGDSSEGRWPANLLLTHSPDCERVGDRRVQSPGLRANQGGGGGYTRGLFQGNIGTRQGHGYADADGYETIADWHCAPGCPVAALGEQSGELSTCGGPKTINSGGASMFGIGQPGEVYADRGTAARFFHQSDYMYERLEAADPIAYYAKASRGEREAGLDPRQLALLGLLEQGESTINDGRDKSIDNPYQRGETTRRNTGPCIKPIALTRYLATLLLPPTAYAPRRILCPFGGTGSEAIGAMLAGFEEIAYVERESEYADIARARLAYWRQRLHEFGDPAKDITAKLADAPAGQMELF